jgi:predicted nucleic acid-binding protein
MIVYVETNFILELAFEQDQHQSANEVLRLAENSKIELAFPGFSISESLSKVIRQSRERDEFYRSLVQTLQQLRRSAPYQQSVIDLDPALALLQNIIEKGPDRLLSVLKRALQAGRLLELDISSFNHALAYKNQLSIEDSIVYATIVSDLKYRPHNEIKLFLSRDEKAFGKVGEKKKEADFQRINVELKSYNCEYVGHFEHGLRFIEAELRKAE